MLHSIWLVERTRASWRHEHDLEWSPSDGEGRECVTASDLDRLRIRLAGRPPLQNSNLAGNNWESWGGRGSDVIQSRQQKQLGYFSMRQVSSWKVFAVFTNTIEIRTELVRDKSMPASRCLVQDCNNGSNPREGISLHNSPPSGSVLSSWKRFVSPHRKNFNPTCRFVVFPEHNTDDCFARSYHVEASMKRLVKGAIPSVWKKKLKTIYFLVIVAL